MSKQRIVELKPGMEVVGEPGDVLIGAIEPGTHGMNVRDVPYFEQYLGLWCMHEATMHQLLNWVQNVDLVQHLMSDAAIEARAGNASVVTQQSVAVIELRGSLMKQRSSMRGGTSTVEARRTLRELAANPDVGAIVLHIDSPGGTVSGTKELADEVANTKAKKPVIAYIEDLGASAAYWVASQASEVYSNATASVGSIGTYGVVYDASGAAEKAGIKVQVIRAGEFKGMLTPGTEVTDKQVELLQGQVNQLNQFFLDGVAAGRALEAERVKSVATGQVWIGKAAQSMGLTDGVKTFDEVVMRAQELMRASGDSRVAASVSNQTEVTMSDSKPVAATIQEIKAACPNASSDFVLAQMEAGATLEKVKDAYMADQQARHQAELERLKAEHEEQIKQAKAEAIAEAQKSASASRPAVGSAPVPVVGGSPSPTPGRSAGTASEQWKSLVRKYVAEGLSASDAMDRIEQEYPGLRVSMVREESGQPDWEECLTYDD